MPILLALLICAAITSAVLLLLDQPKHNQPSLLDLWAHARIEATMPAKCRAAAISAPELPYFYCERTKRYRDATTKRFIPSPV